jgi:hypothetical protein
VTRQSFVIVDNTNTLIDNVGLKPIYDPVARTLTIVGPDGPGRQWLTPDQSYKLAFFIPEDKTSDNQGLRAIDRATLEPKQRLQFVFRAGPPAHQATFEPKVDFCTDVLPLFVAKCSGGRCHGMSTDAAASLVLGSSEGVRITAIGRVAQGSNVDALSSTPAPTPSLFRSNMAIIARGDPGSSWLMYKIEMAPPPNPAIPKGSVVCNPKDASVPPSEPAPPLSLAVQTDPSASASERDILNSYILGRAMPYGTPDQTSTATSAWFTAPFDFQERERIRLWIAQGADTPACGTCEAN